MHTQEYIRNFAIVAHIDHGKSTLADRLLEHTHTIDPRLMKDQVLDSNPIERERGITIKLAPVRMRYTFQDEEYILNLIDTPGHVDFSYEVSRSLSACEGIILVVDATQGIQAQTVAHMQLITQNRLKVIPVVNKIDLPTANVEEVSQSLVETFGFLHDDIIPISAKSGSNIPLLLDAIIQRIPSPKGNKKDSPRALVFSSQYDTHRGVVVYVRIVDGEICVDTGSSLSSFKETKLIFCASAAAFTPVEIGVFTPEMKKIDKLQTGEVGYIATGLKDVTLARIGDTIAKFGEKILQLPGYRLPKPMVYLSLFPVDNDEFMLLRDSLEKLHLSDSSFTYTLHSSPALGKGYLCGFLGLLHAEILKERLENEFSLTVITTAPTVEYEIQTRDGKTEFIHTPNDFPDPSRIAEVKEPYMFTTVFAPKDTVGNIMQLSSEKRGELVNLEYVGNQAKFTYVFPLAEMIIDFFDRLKSISAGYASLDYEFFEYRNVQAVELEVLVNKKKVDAFSQIVVKDHAQRIATKLVEKLKDTIPRHQFQIPIQAIIGGKVIARSDVKAFRKDVTAKLYGGDQSRKDKLLDKQKKGKKRLKSFGNVSIPQEVFLSIYR